MGVVCGWLGAWTRCSNRPSEVRPCLSDMGSVDEPWVESQSVSAKTEGWGWEESVISFDVLRCHLKSVEGFGYLNFII